MFRDERFAFTHLLDGEVAGDVVSSLGVRLLQSRDIGLTDLPDLLRAARLERAARRWVDWAGDATFEEDTVRLATRIGVRDR